MRRWRRPSCSSATAANAAEIKRLEGLMPRDSNGNIVPDAHLVLFDPQDNYYGVLYGNIDAKHVAVFVPGVGTDDNIDNWSTKYAYNIYNNSPDTAVIMWDGYPDPGKDGPSHLNIPGTLGQSTSIAIPDQATAGFDDRAETGAANLTSFINGMGLQPGQSLTIVAHSYGSTVTGIALSQDHLHPTNVVVAGSPGMNVDGVGQLGLSSRNMYALKAPGDPVAQGPEGGGGLGTDPTDPAFGATRLQTNSTGENLVSGHSDYFDPQTQSLKSITDVIQGNVPASDVQAPSTANWVQSYTTRALENPLTDWAAQHYTGPGHDVLQGVDHVSDGIAHGAGTLAGDATDGAIHTAKSAWHDATNPKTWVGPLW